MHKIKKVSTEYVDVLCKICTCKSVYVRDLYTRLTHMQIQIHNNTDFVPPQTHKHRHTHMCTQKPNCTDVHISLQTRTQIPSWYSLSHPANKHNKRCIHPNDNAHKHTPHKYREHSTYMHAHIYIITTTPDMCMRLLSENKQVENSYFIQTHCRSLSLWVSFTHILTHVASDVTWLAASTVHDRLHLAAPEMGRQSGHCSDGVIQRWDKLRRTGSKTPILKMRKTC